jgi:hypothetical protein
MIVAADADSGSATLMLRLPHSSQTSLKLLPNTAASITSEPPCPLYTKASINVILALKFRTVPGTWAVALRAVRPDGSASALSIRFAGRGTPFDARSMKSHALARLGRRNLSMNGSLVFLAADSLNFAFTQL